MRALCAGILLSSLGVLADQASAQQLLETYEAKLSIRDHFNSAGDRLTTAAAILRQDRANFHRFMLRDKEDTGDHFFANAENRARLEAILDRQMTRELAAAIITGTPLVRVEIYQTRSGPFVLVKEISDNVAAQPAQAEGGSRAPASAESAENNEKSSGTGFFVSTDGKLLTNYHVVQNCKTMSVKYGELSTPVSALVVATDPSNDLAVLATKLSPTTVPAFDMRTNVGASVYLYGFPLSGLLSDSGNFSSGTITAAAGVGNNSSMLQMSAPVQPGNSGGPLVDEAGNVIGIVVAKLNALTVAKVTSDIPQNVNFAIKASVAKSFLETRGLTIDAPLQSKSRSGVELASWLKQFTAQVLCN